MAINDTDTFLANRLSNSYSIAAENLMATLEDTDLMLVNRGGQSYKVTGLEVKESIKPPINVVLPVIISPADGGNPDAKSVIFISSTPEFDPAGAPATWSDATWEVSTDINFNSVMTTTKPITPGVEQTLDVGERGSIVLDEDVETDYWVRVTYNATNGSNIEKTSDAVAFTAAVSTGWQLASPRPPQSVWRSVAYGGPPGQEVFVAVASGGTDLVMWSTDGVAWSTVGVTGVPAKSWMTVAWGEADSKFIAVAMNGSSVRAMWSSDGKQWQSGTTSNAEQNMYNETAYSNGRYVAVPIIDSTSGIAFPQRGMYSDNGTSWTRTNRPQNIVSWLTLAAGTPGGSRIYVGTTDNLKGTFHVYTSGDGVTWTVRNNLGTYFRALAYGGPPGQELFVSSTWLQGKLATSTNGTNFTVSNAGVLPESNWNNIIWGGDKFVGVGQSGLNRVMISSDGLTWTPVSAAANYSWIDVAYGGPPGQEKFVSVAFNGDDRVMYSNDGTGDPATILFFDEVNQTEVTDQQLLKRTGVIPDAAYRKKLHIAELTEQPTYTVAGYIAEGDKYKPIPDYTHEIKEAKAALRGLSEQLTEAEIEPIVSVEDDT